MGPGQSLPCSAQGRLGFPNVLVTSQRCRPGWSRPLLAAPCQESDASTGRSLPPRVCAHSARLCHSSKVLGEDPAGRAGTGAPSTEKHFLELLDPLYDCRPTQKRTSLEAGHGVSHIYGARCLHVEPIQRHPHHRTDCRPGWRTRWVRLPSAA